MRGLETRVLLARARILFFVDAAAANTLMANVRACAELDGWLDAACGITVPPCMFADEPNLEHNWMLGQDRYQRGVPGRACTPR